MITPMMKYSLVVYRDDYRAFLEKLQELGMVDITVTSWEPDEVQLELMGEIENYRNAVTQLAQLEKSRGKPTQEEFPETSGVRNPLTPEAAYEAYSRIHARLEELTGELAKITKRIEELKPWGAFDVKRIEELRVGGIELHFYSLFISEYEERYEAWNEKYAVEEISRDMLRSYFIIAAPAGKPLEVDAQELNPPTADYREKEKEAQFLRREIAEQEKTLSGLIPYRANFEQELDRLKSRLQLEEAAASGRHEAEGTLILLEGWAPTEQDKAVEETLEQTGALYLKDRPTPDDEVPVLLKNGKISRLFELIGNFYSLPKYGTMDLTRYFAPFYMIFFAFCLGDSGYGLLIFLLGLFLLKKGTGKEEGETMLASVGKLSMICGAATVVFGFFGGSFFGISLAEFPRLAAWRAGIFDHKKLFTLALGLGLFQIYFAMVLKVINITRQYGFRYTLSTIGWMIALGNLLVIVPHKMDMLNFTTHFTPYWIGLGVGTFLMLFLNSPGKNPILNFGTGIWNAYNDITGFLSDFLSYIRLFAIGLSGGILAAVFNNLALGLAPDFPVIKQVVILAILLIGHGLNLFMSTLSSFVHPMRLTFVEFYKNAGFETTTREFRPLKRHQEK